MTIRDFEREFPDDSACLEYIFKLKFADKPCPKCGKVNGFYRVRARKCYACSVCGKQVSPTAGTIFHKSETSLRTWFYCILFMTNAKNGVAALELQRHFGMTYKTAWRIARQIRKVMIDEGNILSGIVEGDETYIGGKHKFDERFSSKTPVLGLVERGGSVKAKAVNTASVANARKFIEANVSSKAEIHTDTARIYSHVSRKRTHAVINHAEHEYARGNVTTNTIEGFWSQMKRSIDGTYHQVSPKHLQHYVDEFAYSYSHRHDRYPLFYSVLAQTLK